MVLRMENFNILGVHWKIGLLGGRSQKNNIAGRDCLKRGAWTVCRFKGGLGKNEGGGVFEEGLIPQCALWEWYKIWRETYFLFQKWQELGEFWSEHQKVYEICTLIDPFCAKYTTFDLKKYKGVYFMTKDSCKIWRKIELWFGKWHEKFGKFLSEHLKMSKLNSWDLFGHSRKCMSHKLHEIQRSYK